MDIELFYREKGSGEPLKKEMNTKRSPKKEVAACGY